MNWLEIIISLQAEEMFSRLVKQMAALEGITEQLKDTDQMAWVGKMNSIQSREMAIVNNEIVLDNDGVNAFS